MVLVAAGIWLDPGAAAATDSPDHAVVAEMGGVRLTQAQFRTIVGLLDDEARARLKAAPALAEPLARQEVLSLYLLREAKDHGIDRKPEVVAAMEHAAVQALIAAYLTEQSAPPADSPSAQQVRAYYDNNHDQFHRPPQVHLLQIFLAVAVGADKPTQERVAAQIRDLHKALKKNPDSFGALARTASQHASAGQGGDLGWVGSDTLLPGLVPVLARMKPGQISPPIRSDQGWHLIKLIERRPGPQLGFDEVKAAIAVALRQKLSQQRRQTYVDNLLERIPPMIHRDAIP
jgi:peptidylprolyl isomerase